MFRWIPILLEHSARAEILRESNKFGCGLRAFRWPGRLGYLQMQCHELCVKNITAIERTSDCRKPFDLRGDFNRHAVTPAEIAIELVQRTQPPFLKASAFA